MLWCNKPGEGKTFSLAARALILFLAIALLGFCVHRIPGFYTHRMVRVERKSPLLACGFFRLWYHHAMGEMLSLEAKKLVYEY